MQYRGPHLNPRVQVRTQSLLVDATFIDSVDMPDEDLKSQLRQNMRKARQSLTQGQRHDLAKKLENHVVQSSLFQKSGQIAGYMPFECQIDPKPILKHDLS